MSNNPNANANSADTRPVDISFDCIPLRSMARLDPPLDASPGLVAKYGRIKNAIAEHGTFNSYYLHNATCRFFVTNDPKNGMIAFKFEGVVFTDDTDLRARHTALKVTLDKETCPWLEQHVVKWFEETVSHAVIVEFDRYIGVGDPEQTKKRMQQLERAVVDNGGFVGMHL